ncbi:MAG TPA: hypothetical protein VE913_23700, partial [Longimicrobium sp.]|nr:hypothetical protein [Longimicrobium sp.]
MTLADVIHSVLDDNRRLARLFLATLGLAGSAAIGVRVFLALTEGMTMETEELEISTSPRVVMKRKVGGNTEYVLVVQPQRWQSSGISVRKGDNLRINAQGNVNVSLNGLLDHLRLRRSIDTRILAQLDSGKIVMRADSSRLPERYYSTEDHAAIRLRRPWVGPSGYSGMDGVTDHRYPG